jgi:hypothetical protein
MYNLDRSVIRCLVLLWAVLGTPTLNGDYYFQTSYPCDDYHPLVTDGHAYCQVKGTCYPSLHEDTINAHAWAQGCSLPIDIEALTSGNASAIQGHAQTSGPYG